jgi:uncharacterized membrane protein
VNGDANDRTEAMLGRVLTIGSRTSTAILAAGLLLTLLVPAAHTASWLLTAGLITLLFTPIARVAASVLAFARRGEWTFVLCTAAVLALLIVGIIVALAD